MKQAEILEYIRNGESSTVEFKTEDVHPNALAEEIVAFANFEFDETPVLKASIESLDLAKINAYLTDLQQSPLNEEGEQALIRELLNLSILIELDNRYYPTLSGLLMFGKQPQKYFPSYTILCGAYQGNGFLADCIREHELTGSLDTMIEDALAFLKLTMPQTSTRENGIRNKVAYAYPIEALREGLVNAVCHRDYAISGSAIRVFVFHNRLEIRSPGGLPNTMTLENIRYRQFTRNQMIASFLTGAGYMERRGKGIMRMLKFCAEADLRCEFMLTPDLSEFVVTYTRNL